MSSELAFLPVGSESRPGWEHQQQLQEQRRWEEEREANLLAMRVAQQFVSNALLPWVSDSEARIYQICAQTLLKEAGIRKN